MKMTKTITWEHEGKTHEGTATFENGTIALRNNRGEAFETLEANEIENGMTLEEIWEGIPEDVTGFSLK